ncbi:uncharacterized protein VTP21DRAFT_8591 [Calcarisporiella thermophila]|uniref:uncharacterized protein n=1 Tax=Calcarisporiella thermophila TaxID=911321 RepID=UPI0037423310
MAALQSLPAELLHDIFTHLDCQLSLSEISKVSHHFRSIALPILYRAPQFKTVRAFNAFLQIPESLGSLVREIDLSMTPHRWRLVDDTHMEKLTHICNKLERVDFGYTKITDLGVQLLCITNGMTLRSLTVSQCPKLTDEFMFAIAESCKNLEQLDISETRVTDDGLMPVASRGQLRWLSIAHCDIDEGVRLLRTLCPNLDYLDKHGVYYIGSDIEDEESDEGST